MFDKMLDFFFLKKKKPQHGLIKNGQACLVGGSPENEEMQL